MSDKIDMSLDDIIKLNRGHFRSRGSRGRRGFSRGRGRGTSLRGGRGTSDRRGRRPGNRGRIFSNRGNFSATRAKQAFSESARFSVVDSKRGNITRGVTKLLISNLEYGVSDTDIKELFAEFGAIRKAAVHYDRTGRSLGTAEVVFERRFDAARAMKEYNGVPLDGRQMKIQITSSFVPPLQSPRGTRGSQISRGFGRGRGQGRGRRGISRN